MICRAVQGARGGPWRSDEEFAAVVAEHDEDEEQAVRQGRHEEEVDGDDVSGMRGENGAPRPRRPR